MRHLLALKFFGRMARMSQADIVILLDVRRQEEVVGDGKVDKLEQAGACTIGMYGPRP